MGCSSTSSSRASRASNSLVAAGNIEGSEGKYAVKVPSLIETPEDIANLPVVATPTAVVRAKEMATVRSTFKDAETVTRLDGKPAIAIEVKKRIGANLIDTLGTSRPSPTTSSRRCRKA